MSSHASGPNAVLTRMLRLPFERTCLVESRECPRCEGSGSYGGGRNGTICFTCRGWARLPTVQGRELLDSLGTLIGGRPAYDEKGRFLPSTHLYGSELRAGMSVKPMRGFEAHFRRIASIDEGAHRLVTFHDRTRLLVYEYDSFVRSLTGDDIDRADAWLAQHIGRGAVEVP